MAVTKAFKIFSFKRWGKYHMCKLLRCGYWVVKVRIVEDGEGELPHLASFEHLHFMATIYIYIFGFDV